MRSAIFYPERQITDPEFLRNSLLLWDELHVIDTNPERPRKDVPDDVQAAWKIIGKSFRPTEDEKWYAHEMIVGMLERPEFLMMIPQDEGRGRTPDSAYELYPDKFLQATWSILLERAKVGKLSNGDFGTSEAIATAIMSKLAEACAGEAFARVTNRIRGFALAADSNPADAGGRVVPVALGLIDLSKIDLATAVEFREKEESDPSYRDLRHRYLDDVEKHLTEIRSVKKLRDKEELERIHVDTLRKHLRDLKDGMKTNRLQLAVQAVVSVVVTAGSALVNPAALAGNAFGSVKMIGELFKNGLTYGTQQRALMSDNPMAYMYMLDRAARRR
jgi:hypothetical protein